MPRAVPRSGAGLALRAPAPKRKPDTSYPALIRDQVPNWGAPAAGQGMYWRFNETAGATFANTSMIKQTLGVYGGTPAWTTSGIGQSSDTATSMDGSTQYVAHLSGTSEFAQGAIRSYGGWAKQANNVTLQTLMGGGIATNSCRLSIAANGNDVNWTPDVGVDSTGVTWQGAWPGTGEWVHWVLAVNATTDATLYINGVSQGTSAIVANFSASPSAIVFGNSGNPAAGYWAGAMDECFVFMRALTARECLQQYETGRKRYLLYDTGSYGAYHDAVMLQSPSLYWLLDFPSGNYYATDLTNNSYQGRVMGEVDLTYQNAGSLDGTPALGWPGPASAADTTQWAVVKANTYQPFAAGSSRTFVGSTYIRSTVQSGAIQLLSGSGRGNAHPTLEVLTASKDVYWWSDISGINANHWTAPWPAWDQWVHWALTYNATSHVAELFINGVSKGQLSAGLGDYNASSGYLQIGGRGVRNTYETGDGFSNHIAVFESILPNPVIANFGDIALGLGGGDESVLYVGSDKVIRQPEVFTTP